LRQVPSRESHFCAFGIIMMYISSIFCDPTLYLQLILFTYQHFTTSTCVCKSNVLRSEAVADHQRFTRQTLQCSRRTGRNNLLSATSTTLLLCFPNATPSLTQKKGQRFQLLTAKQMNIFNKRKTTLPLCMHSALKQLWTQLQSTQNNSNRIFDKFSRREKRPGN